MRRKKYESKAQVQNVYARKNKQKVHEYCTTNFSISGFLMGFFLGGGGGEGVVLFYTRTSF